MDTDLPKDMEDALSAFDTSAGEIVRSFATTVESQKAPEVIYHYTDDAGLRGILEAGQLWLSDIFSLNDPRRYATGFPTPSVF
jgi:hypothetical protein